MAEAPFEGIQALLAFVNRHSHSPLRRYQFRNASHFRHYSKKESLRLFHGGDISYGIIYTLNGVVGFCSQRPAAGFCQIRGFCPYPEMDFLSRERERRDPDRHLIDP